MVEGRDRLWRVATTALLLLMCIVSVGMLVGLASFHIDAGRQVIIRFVVVAALPFVWFAVLKMLRRSRLGAALLFGLTAAVFVAFVGAVDFANGRPLYSWVPALVG